MQFQKSITDSKDNWQTPMWLFNELNAIFTFTLDGAADSSNYLIEKYSTDFFNEIINNQSVFINPPFSELKNGLWNKHALQLSINNFILMLQPFRPETKYWHQFIWQKADVFVFNKRIQYVHPNTKREMGGVPMPSCLVLYGDYDKNSIKKLSNHGILIKKEATYATNKVELLQEPLSMA